VRGATTCNGDCSQDCCCGVLQILHWFDPLGLKKSLWLKPTPALVNSLDETLIFFEFFYEERMLVISRGFLWCIGVVPCVFARFVATLALKFLFFRSGG
jgi:hypothetical protein